MDSMTMIETSKIIELSECNLETKCLLTGTLLKWMDIIACLCAEKHAGSPCVTASVDDLQITRTISLGQVVILRAWINRAFNTSMEVEVLVQSEDINEVEKHIICQAYFTFVTQPTDSGEKCLVKPIIPVTDSEKLQFSLANERKKMRLDYRASLKKMKDDSFDDRDSTLEDFDLIPDDDHIYSESTKCEFVDIVLPQHANHHQTTFGGQLMAWFESTGTISARRLCHNHPRLVAVDEVFFRAPSKVGDRIVIKSQVNNTFEKSMEVGVRVEAYAIGKNIRHIQSAYLTFISPDENGNPRVLPSIIPKDKESLFRMERAVARKVLRQERRTILNSTSENVSVRITKSNQNVLSYKNIVALMELYSSAKFKMKVQVDGIQLFQAKIDGFLCIRIECVIDVSPYVVFKVLSDHQKRTYWDLSVFDVSVVKELRRNEDYVLHYFMHNLSPRDKVKGDDFVVLASLRKDNKEKFIIAYRSVSLKDIPAVPEFNRSEIRCSGFVIESCSSGDGSGRKLRTKLTYINQLTNNVYQYIKSDLKGATDTFAQKALSLKKLLETSEEKPSTP